MKIKMIDKRMKNTEVKIKKMTRKTLGNKGLEKKKRQAEDFRLKSKLWKNQWET